MDALGVILLIVGVALALVGPARAYRIGVGCAVVGLVLIVLAFLFVHGAVRY